MASPASDITVLLRAVRDGDRDSMDRLFRIVYDELRTIAHAHRRRWTGNETLQTTAIVHEAYLKLVRAESVQSRDRSHFFTLASKAMRQILVNYARDQGASKRGDGAPHVSLDSPAAIVVMDAAAAEQLIELDRALEALESFSERHARVVECRFFAGLSVVETAQAIGTSPATVKRDWARASVWLRERLDPDGQTAVSGTSTSRSAPEGPDSDAGPVPAPEPRAPAEPSDTESV